MDIYFMALPNGTPFSLNQFVWLRERKMLILICESNILPFGTQRFIYERERTFAIPSTSERIRLRS